MHSIGFENMTEYTVHQQPQHVYPHAPNTVYPQAPSTVVVVDQGPRLAGQRQNIAIWSAGLYSCFEDMGSCIFNMFCPCIHACTVADKMNESCWVPTCFGQAGHMAMRTKLRTAYGIQGSIFGDCCSTTWCGYCTMCQMEREINIRGAHIF